MRVNAQEEKRKHGITCNTSSPLGDGSPAEGLPSLASSKEAPSLPTKAPSYEAKRPAPKAQDRVPRRGTLLRSGQYDNCAKRHSVSSFRAKREIFVIHGLAINDWKFQTGNLLSTYLRASPHIYCSEAATTTLNPEPINLNPEPSSLLKTLHEKPLDTAASN